MFANDVLLLSDKLLDRAKEFAHRWTPLLLFQANDFTLMPEVRRAMPDSQMMLGRRADGLAMLQYGAVLKKVVHDVEEPFAQLAGVHIDVGNLDLHVP